MDGGPARCVFFDTEPQGKYVLGLIYAPPGDYTGSLAAPPAKAERQASLAVRVRRPRHACGLPLLGASWDFRRCRFTHPKLWDLRYHGKPGDFDANLGWQKHGDVQYEWIQPTKGPTTYMDHMAKYGEGIHHIAFAVSDIEREEGGMVEGRIPDIAIRRVGRSRPARLRPLCLSGHPCDRRHGSRAFVELPQVSLIRFS